VVANTGTAEDATRATERAQSAFPAWRDLPHERRAAVIRQAAAALRAGATTWRPS
jgi:acyl-CoA reductase-like NAD-dependent aldehyde dehydrogenase